MLFLALPPADMLPPAGHRAGPGRSHSDPITRSGPPGGRPCALPRVGAAAAEAEAAPQSRSNSTSRPRSPRSSRPATGAWDREAGLAPSLKVSAGEIPAWSPRGKAARSGPQEGHRPQPVPESQRADLRAHGTPQPSGGRRWHTARGARSRAPYATHARQPGGTLLRNRSPLIRVRMRLPPRRISAPSSLDCVSTGKHSLWLAPVAG